MRLSDNNEPTAEAFRGFIEGVQSLNDYLRTNAGEKLVAAESQLDESLKADPDFAAAQYYKAIVLTHARDTNQAISILEDLNQANPPFKTEVLYNLAFAYARTYKHDNIKKSLNLLDEADQSAHRTFAGWRFKAKRADLVLLIRAMKAWVIGVLARGPYDHPETLEQRQRDLPNAAHLAQTVLGDPRLKRLPKETQRAIEAEAHNAAGIAYMRMGQYAPLFKNGDSATNGDSTRGIKQLRLIVGKNANEYWDRAVHHYNAALEVHPQDVRVLDNIATLNLIRSCHAIRNDRIEDAQLFASQALEAENKAISYNPHDRFRHYNLAKALALLGEWEEAMVAAEKILKERGAVTEDKVDKFKAALARNDKDFILEQYPTHTDLSS